MTADALMGLMLLASLAGCGYLVAAAVLAGRFVASPRRALATPAPSVTVLKPLYGDEPGLYENLVSVGRQNFPGAVQIICGVANAGDPAVRAVERLIGEHPGWTVDLVVDPTVHGDNLKVSNLINMAARIRNDVVVLSDSDIRLRPDDLAQVVAALQQPGVGAVTCLYAGGSTGGAWSDLAAIGLTSHFLPNAIVGIVLGRAKPCFGSLIALRRSTLEAIGGFPAFADTLADDYAIGAAVRARGETVAVPPLAVVHRCDEPSLGALWSHELRWARTVLSLDPIGYMGSIVTHPLPLALLGFVYGGGRLAFGLAFAAIACRVGLALRIGRIFDVPVPGLALVPVRDLLTFAVFVGSFLGRGVSWKDRHYRMQSGGGFTEDAATRGRLDL